MENIPPTVSMYSDFVDLRAKGGAGRADILMTTAHNCSVTQQILHYQYLFQGGSRFSKDKSARQRTIKRQE